MTPHWFPALAFAFGFINAAVIVLAGVALTVATAVEDSDELEKVRVRVARVLGTFVGANMVAAVLFGAFRLLLG